MPIYDYLCSACDHRADILHGINDPGPNFCPSCGAEGTMKKQVAAPAVHFKGSGWAKKDRSSASRSGSSTKDDAGTTSDDGGSQDDGSKGDGATGSGVTKSDGVAKTTTASDSKAPGSSTAPGPSAGPAAGSD